MADSLSARSSLATGSPRLVVRSRGGGCSTSKAQSQEEEFASLGVPLPTQTQQGTAVSTVAVSQSSAVDAARTAVPPAPAPVATDDEAKARAKQAAACAAAASFGFDGAAMGRLLRSLSSNAERPPHLGPEALLDSVASGAIAPLKGSWLVALQARGGTLTRRQVLPPEAFWTAAELRALVEALGDDYGLLFVALSYRRA